MLRIVMSIDNIDRLLTCTLCGTSSSVEVGGRRAGMWILSRRVMDMSMVPSLAEETPRRRPILVIS